MSGRTKSLERLSYAIASLAVFAAAVGLLHPGLYRDNDLVSSAWRGNDLVTLFVAAALLAVSRLRSSRSPRLELTQLGLLDYMLYNYAFYLFGAAFNALFLAYAAIVILSAGALILGVLGFDAEGTARRFDAGTPVQPIAAFMLLVATGLVVVYGIQCLGFVVTGEVPGVVAATGHPTSVVFALDLTLVVPPLVIGAVWLWQRRPWGYVLAVIINVKAATYMVALAVATLTAWEAGASATLSQLYLWANLGLASGFAAMVLLRRIRPTSTRHG